MKVGIVGLGLIGGSFAKAYSADGIVFRRTLPDISVIRRFRELGGKYVTIGSDAHRWGDIGSGIETGLDMLLECGYTHFSVYEKHCPKLLPIL